MKKIKSYSYHVTDNGVMYISVDTQDETKTVCTISECNNKTDDELTELTETILQELGYVIHPKYDHRKVEKDYNVCPNLFKNTDIRVAEKVLHCEEGELDRYLWNEEHGRYNYQIKEV